VNVRFWPPREPDDYHRFHPPAWMEFALCAETDPELFFPEKGAASSQIRAAKRVCAACPVTAQCLDLALANRERYGIFGGYTEHERRRLKRGREAA
jgi:WhiB family redox-sensing transcriptional regulator